MRAKTKIISILPYWLLGLALAVSLTSFPFSRFENVSNQNNILPKVLGETTNEPYNSSRTNSFKKTEIEKKTEPNTAKILAESFLVFDLETGQELIAKSQNDKLSIASLTKLMTGLVAYENLDLNSKFQVSTKDRLDIQPQLGLLAGDRVLGLDVFNAMLIGSCNDAALALSNFTENQTALEFSILMNLQAKELGMTNTSFSNPIGFDNEANFSTAEDLKKLITKTQGLSVFTDLGRRESYDFVGDLKINYYTKATNQLIKSHPDILAIKTGFTNFSGGAMVTKFIKNGRQIVILVLDSQNREGDTLKLKALTENSFSF